MRNHYFFACLMSAFAIFSIATDAHAYIDPGTGSIILQSIIAAISMATVAIFSFRAYIARLWRQLLGSRYSKAPMMNHKRSNNQKFKPRILYN